MSLFIPMSKFMLFRMNYSPILRLCADVAGSKSSSKSTPVTTPVKNTSWARIRSSWASLKEAGKLLKIAETFLSLVSAILMSWSSFSFSNIFFSFSNRSRSLPLASFNVATSLSAESAADGVAVPLLLLLPLGESPILKSSREGIAVRATVFHC